MEDINRIKLVLIEKKRSRKWHSEQIGVNPSVVSNLQSLFIIAYMTKPREHCIRGLYLPLQKY